MTAAPHPEIASLAFLLGTWRGRGAGDYPTIEAFDYVEEATFAHVGKPFVSYVQKTRHADTGLPLHSESGYLRPAGPGRVELVIAQPSGIVEIDDGSVTDGTIEVRSQMVATTATAKQVTEVVRRMTVAGDRLEYAVDMAAVGHPLQFHLRAVLERVAD